MCKIINRLAGAVLLLILGIALAHSDELPLQVQPPWKLHDDSGQQAYRATYPTSSPVNYKWLSAKVDLKERSFYRITWKTKSSGAQLADFLQLGIELGEDKWVYAYALGTEWNSYTYYFYSGECTSGKLRFYVVENARLEIDIKNVEMTLVAADQLESNLLTDGSFEDCNGSAPSWRTVYDPKKHASDDIPITILPSKDFISGEKSMAIDLAHADGTPTLGIKSIYLPAELGKRVEFKFWAKADNEAVISASINGYGPIHTGTHFYRLEKFKVSSDWKEYKVIAEIPTDTSKYPDLLRKIICLEIRIDQDKEPKGGKIYFDDISFINQ